MDTFVTRYTHMGQTFVHDAYTGATIPAEVYDMVTESRSTSYERPVYPITHPLLRKMVTFQFGGQTLTGRFSKLDGSQAVVKVAGVTYFLDPAGLKGV